ncbi:phosphoglyceromutase [Mycobacterium intracellulare]|uniref:phosphoglyceromutase n=1 Tax=Mycobacterium intracellulare TaxID=1767 RepID=UPI0033603D78
MGKPAILLLVRHGESVWNAQGLFSGWVDVSLSKKGEAEAARAGQLIHEHGLQPDRLHTSVLRRAISSAHIMLDAADRHWIPVRRSWRLNERHYGALQGLNKGEVRQKYGDEQFLQWRRSYRVPPPPIDPTSRFSQGRDARYLGISGGPMTECLADVAARLLPYYTDVVIPQLLDGKTVLVVAHGNSLRALVKHLDNIADDDIAGLNIPTGIPLRYDLDERMAPAVRGGVYLDPEAAAEGAAAVATEGMK